MHVHCCLDCNKTTILFWSSLRAKLFVTVIVMFLIKADKQFVGKQHSEAEVKTCSWQKTENAKRKPRQRAIFTQAPSLQCCAEDLPETTNRGDTSLLLETLHDRWRPKNNSLLKFFYRSYDNLKQFRSFLRLEPHKLKLLWDTCLLQIRRTSEQPSLYSQMPFISNWMLRSPNYFSSGIPSIQARHWARTHSKAGSTKHVLTKYRISWNPNPADWIRGAIRSLPTSAISWNVSAIRKSVCLLPNYAPLWQVCYLTMGSARLYKKICVTDYFINR